MSRFATITATNAVIDTLTANTVQSVSTSGIQVISDVDLNSKNLVGANKVGFTTYEILEDSKANTLAIRVAGTRFKGAIYDATLNKPYEQILPVTLPYTLPSQIITLQNDILTNPAKLFVIEPTENTVIELPAISSTGIFQNTHVRFSNNTNFLVSFFYNGIPIIQIGYERASFVWQTTNGIDFNWIYVA
jgi:hypothetical protein